MSELSLYEEQYFNKEKAKVRDDLFSLVMHGDLSKFLAEVVSQGSSVHDREMFLRRLNDLCKEFIFDRYQEVGNKYVYKPVEWLEANRIFEPRITKNLQADYIKKVDGLFEGLQDLQSKKTKK
jgi:hypothetical protein